MKLFPRSISFVAPGRYLVVLETLDPSGVHEFTFSVDGDHIRVLQTPAEFHELTRQRAWMTKPLLDAILTFDAAQGVELP
jgi:hypothetical protein